MKRFYQNYQSPLGNICIEATGIGIKKMSFSETKIKSQFIISNHITIQAQQQLSAYFSKSLITFSVPLDLQGTDFQKKVWEALLQIPFGKLATYSDIAKQINQPKAPRAVGQAVNKNPIAIVIPCHRVIGKNQHLTGFAAGIETKNALLHLENHIIINNRLTKPHAAK